jgi:hypothetical protein
MPVTIRPSARLMRQVEYRIVHIALAIATSKITAGDRAGAAMLTVTVLIFFVGGSVWLLLFD